MPKDEFINDILIVKEAAAYIRISRAQMYRLLEQRQIPYILLGQKRKVIRKEALEAWLHQQTILPRQ